MVEKRIAWSFFNEHESHESHESLARRSQSHEPLAVGNKNEKNAFSFCVMLT